MDKEQVLKTVAQFELALRSYGVQATKIILFGSHAQGCADRDSDIDLVVVSDDFIGKDFWKRIDVLSQAICDVWASIEAIAVTREEWQQAGSSAAALARDGEQVFAA